MKAVMELYDIQKFVVEAIARSREARQESVQLVSLSASHRRRAVELCEESAKALGQLFVSLGVAIDIDSVIRHAGKVEGHMELSDARRSTLAAIDSSRNTRQKSVLLTYVAANTRQCSAALRAASANLMSVSKSRHEALRATLNGSRAHSVPEQKKLAQSSKAIPPR